MNSVTAATSAIAIASGPLPVPIANHRWPADSNASAPAHVVSAKNPRSMIWAMNEPT